MKIIIKKPYRRQNKQYSIFSEIYYKCLFLKLLKEEMNETTTIRINYNQIIDVVRILEIF